MLKPSIKLAIETPSLRFFSIESNTDSKLLSKIDLRIVRYSCSSIMPSASFTILSLIILLSQSVITLS